MVLFPFMVGLFCNSSFVAGAIGSFLRPETLRCVAFHSGSASPCPWNHIDLPELFLLLFFFYFFTPSRPQKDTSAAAEAFPPPATLLFSPTSRASAADHGGGGSFILWLKHWSNSERRFLRGSPSEVRFEFRLDSGLNVFFLIFTRCNNGSDFRCFWTSRPDGIRRPTTLEIDRSLEFRRTLRWLTDSVRNYWSLCHNLKASLQTCSCPPRPSGRNAKRLLGLAAWMKVHLQKQASP